MKHTVLTAMAGIGIVFGTATTPATAQTSTTPSGLSGPLQDLLGGGMSAPSSKAPAVSTKFTPSGSSSAFADLMVAKMPQLNDTQKGQFRQYMGQVKTMVEGAYTSYGYSKNDLGVALGGLLETSYEIDKGTFKVGGNETEADKNKTRAVVRQIQRTLASSPAFKSLSDTNKQTAYDTATFLMGHMAVQWQQAGADTTKQEAVRKIARQQLETLFKLDADKLSRSPSGEFVAKGATAGSTPASAPTTSKTVPNAKAAPPSAASSGPLPPAALNGARLLVKFSLTYTTYASTTFGQLVLFPDGTAFDDVQSDRKNPLSAFTIAELRSHLKPRDIGRWRAAGDSLVLTFPGKTRTLRKHKDGWYDGKGTPPDNPYDIYYPVITASPARLTGAWKNENLSTMGMAGGGAPMVAGGSNSDRFFSANGTFTNDRKSFYSATTANMGDGFKTGGDVTVAVGGHSGGTGRWRIDGPLLTLEENGRRTVHVAFFIPHWSKEGPTTDILIDGDRWERPEKK